jgi:hypothetical protein
MYHVKYMYIYIHNSISKGAGERPSTQVQNQVLALLQFGASDPWAWLAAGPSRGDLFGTQNRELWWTKIYMSSYIDIYNDIYIIYNIYILYIIYI